MNKGLSMGGDPLSSTSCPNRRCSLPPSAGYETTRPAFPQNGVFPSHFCPCAQAVSSAYSVPSLKHCPNSTQISCTNNSANAVHLVNKDVHYSEKSRATKTPTNRERVKYIINNIFI